MTSGKSLLSLVGVTTQKEAVLRDRAERAERQVKTLCEDIGRIDTLLSRKEDVLSVINQLQMKAQEKNKAVFENMLTALVHDVMPGKIEKIVLSTRMKNNRASLEIDAITNGELMNIDDELGGSIANLVAMGLRFIVLARHPNRRVLFLDESDCHINESYTAGFARFMQYLSQKMGIQVIYVSHSDPRHFSGNGLVYQLSNVENKTRFKIISSEPEPEEDYEAPTSTIRYVRLKDYGPHENILVELSPRLNIITGDNNTGKSKFIQAIYELCRNETSERRIKRNRPFFEVEIGIEEGMSILWKYSAKGAQKTSMALLDADGAEINKSTSGTGVPEWLHTYLSMEEVNGQDINFQTQKKQNFILSSDFSSGQRAQMLPLGRESRDVMRMNVSFLEKLRLAQANRKSIEKSLNVHQNELATMSLIIENPVDPSALTEKCNDAIDIIQNLEALDKSVTQLDSITAKVDSSEEGFDRLDRIVTSPVTLIATEELRIHSQGLSRLSAQVDVLSGISKLPEMPTAPTLNDLVSIGQAGARIKQATVGVQALNKLNDLVEAEPPKIGDWTELTANISAIQTLDKSLIEAEASLQRCLNEIQKIADERNRLIEELGGVCPTCSQLMGDHNHG